VAKVLEWLRLWWDDRRPGPLSGAYRNDVLITIDQDIQAINIKIDRLIHEFTR
jgi:hypothetical protein